MKLISATLIAAALAAGCASQTAGTDPNCTEYAERNGRQVCVAWVFGPTKRQQEEWDRRHPAKSQ